MLSDDLSPCGHAAASLTRIGGSLSYGTVSCGIAERLWVGRNLKDHGTIYFHHHTYISCGAADHTEWGEQMGGSG